MYLVLMVRHNRVTHVKAFGLWDEAVLYADDLVMDIRGVTNEMPDWEDGDYRNVCEHNGIAIMIERCDEPGKVDGRFKSNNYGVNLR